MAVDDTQRPPSLGERAVKDTARVFSAQMAVGVVALGCSMWLYRKVPEEDLALWPLTLALSGLVAGFSSWGIGDVFVRSVPRLLARRRRRTAGAFLKTGLLINLLSCALVSVVIYLLAEPVARWGIMKGSAAPHVRLMALATFFAAARERLGWALTATQRFRQAAVETLLVEVPRPLLMVALYWFWGIKGIIITLTVIPCLGCILHMVWLWPSLFPDWSFLSPRALMRRSKAFYGVSLLALARGRLNYAFIPLLADRESLASYFVVDSLVGYLRLLDTKATVVVGPKLAEREAQQPGAREKLYGRCMRYVFLGLLPLHVLPAALATPAVALVGGHKYADAGLVLALLCLGTLLETIVITQVIHIRAFSSPRQFLIQAIFDAVVNLGLFALIVPQWGAMGAAVVLVLRMASLIILDHRLLRPALHARYEPAALVTAVTACLPAAVVAFGFQAWWPGQWWVLFPAGVLGLVLYFLGLRRRLAAEDAMLLLRSFPRGLMGRPRVQAVAQWMAAYVRRQEALPSAAAAPPTPPTGGN